MTRKYLIPLVMISSLGANTYFIAGGAGQYAVAAETLNNQPTENVTVQCTAEHRALFAPILTNHVLAPLNTKWERSMTVNDMRPINRVEMIVELEVPSINGVPQAGAPTGKYCKFTRRVEAKKTTSLANPGE